MKSLDSADRRMLTFIGRYRVATRPVLAELLGSQAAADKRVARLIERGLVRTSRGLPHKRAIYQLTRQGVAALGLSPARARRYGLQALIKHLGLLLVCNNPEQRCERVEPEELTRVLGGEVPDASYCLLQGKDRTLVGIAYVPAPHTPVPTVVRRVRKLGAIVRRSPVLERLRGERRVGVLVVVHAEERQHALTSAVRRPDGYGRPPVIKKTRVWVRCAPELARCLGLGAAGPAQDGSAATEPLATLFDAPEPPLLDGGNTDAPDA